LQPFSPRPSAPTDLRDESPALAPLETAAAVVELSKPGVAGLVVVTMLCGALTAPGSIDLVKLLLALAGTASVVAAANALNMIWERETDALMRRTRTRPLPSGRLSVEVALAFSAVAAASGFAVLLLWVGELAALLTAVALGSYVLAYTPLKRVTPLALFVGAVPGAIPPLVGWASVTGSLDTLGFMHFAILFVWQLPHFLAIAIFRRDEYERAGHRVLPVVHGIPRTKIEMAFYALVLVAVSLLPVGLGLAGFEYAAIALGAGLVFLWLATAGFSAKDDARWARGVFFASMPYLVVVLGALSAFTAS
jgi:protoheme IX farnesyltransferase